jgi:uncharacterized YceG family protein
VSGGYGPGGHRGRGYDGPDYSDGPGQQDWPGSARDSGYHQQGYDQQAYDQRGSESPAYGDQAYRPQGYGDQGYGDRRYRDRGDGQPGYEQQARLGRGYPDRGSQGYHQQAYGDQGYGDGQGYDDQAYRDQGRRQQAGYPDRGDGYRPRDGSQLPRPAAGGQPGYGDYEPGPGEDSSFLPGFGGRDADPGQGPGRGPRYDDDDFSGYSPRGGRPAGPTGPGGPGGRGGPGEPRDWQPDPRDDDDWNGARDQDSGPRPRRRATRWAPRMLILVIFLALVIGGTIGGLSLYHAYNNRYHPADYAGQGTGEVTVQVMSGDTAFSLAPRLVQLGVVASQRAFTNAVESATSTTGATSTGLQAGFYLLHHHMQASLAYAALINPKNLVQTTVTIPEGKRAVDVIAIIAKKTKIPLTNFQQVLAHPSELGLPSYAGGKAEGYLFPATYAIAPHETALQILQAMVTRFNQEAEQINLVSAAKAVGLTPAQLITEASMAQAEGGSVSDYPKIAEVIHNRLARGMHLQFDSTVLYGLGKYATSATLKQTQTPGPYNTYLNPGLPAGPISNPGDAAIQGILQPDHGDWLYFLTVPDGKSEFSATPLQGQ